MNGRVVRLASNRGAFHIERRSNHLVLVTFCGIVDHVTNYREAGETFTCHRCLAAFRAEFQSRKLQQKKVVGR